MTGGFSHAVKLHKENYCKAAEAVDAVNMVSADGEFIVRWVDSIMLPLSFRSSFIKRRSHGVILTGFEPSAPATSIAVAGNLPAMNATIFPFGDNRA